MGTTHRGLVGAVVLTAGLAAGTILAQPAERDLSDHPGYVALGTSSVFDDEHLKVHVSVKDAMLKLVAAAAEESEPELASMIAGLEAIEVRAFDVASAGDNAVRDTIVDTAKRLRSSGWDAAVDVRLEGSAGFLYFRFDDDRPIGLAAMFLEDGGEAVFVNIVGRIDPALLGRLAARFNLTVLGQALAAPGGTSEPEPEPETGPSGDG